MNKEKKKIYIEEMKNFFNKYKLISFPLLKKIFLEKKPELQEKLAF